MKRTSCTLILCALLGGPALACEYPENTVGDDLPRGATATQAEMEAAQRRVASYVRQLEAFAACVDNEPAGRRQALAVQRDKAVAEAQELADRFNRELRAFNRSMQLRQASVN
ncbi:MAG TPA: hypothetical protein VIN61_03005 [Gammaproteobacteria bacterium]